MTTYDDLVFESPRYRLELSQDGLLATLAGPDGQQLASLRPLVILDTTVGHDETLSTTVRRTGDTTFVVERRSTIWESALVTIECREEAFDLRASVGGNGHLTSVRFLAAHSLIAVPRLATGFLASGSRFRTLYTPGPDEPPRGLRPATESATIGVVGDSEPGRRRWLFTPAPLAFALTDATDPVGAEWVTFSLAAPVAEMAFPELTYEPLDGGFALRADYEGHTHVAGTFEAPTLVVTPGLPSPVEGLRRHRDDLIARGHVRVPSPRERADWWTEPMFCGWGAQCRIAERDGGPAPERATQAHYDSFLGHLEHERIVPGTIVIDDKWQATYGANDPDTGKWPDLRGWIADRHERGQHVLLWWKAWDAEGMPPELCVCNAAGVPVALDPSNPRTRTFLGEMVRRLVGREGLGADGFKIDFTARTPSGRALTHHGPRWGIGLLHELLEIVYTATKAAKPDALVITHTPSPLFADVTDMIRLNDISMGEPVCSQMAYRAEVAGAACPELLVDTDDWRMPDRAQWRAYLRLKPQLGVPALYYVDALDAGEPLEPEDYAALRETWASYRDAR